VSRVAPQSRLTEFTLRWVRIRNVARQLGVTNYLEEEADRKET